MAEEAQIIELVPEDPGALTKKVLKAGSGPTPPHGADVSVHYVGTLLDGGKQFDSSRDRGQPFTFKLGQGQVIKGWDVGVATMTRGERSILTLRHDMGYGASGSGGTIPGFASLVFDVELLDFETKEKVTEDGLVVKEVLVAGKGHQKPKPGAQLKVNLIGRVEGKDFLNQQELSFVLGDVEAVPQGVEEVVSKMLVGEKSLVTIKDAAKYGYSAPQCAKLGISAEASRELEFEVELLAAEDGRDSWNLGLEEKLASATALKDQGNKAFALQQFSRAVMRYKAAVDLFQYERDLAGDLATGINQLRVACHANTATVHFRTKSFADCKKVCADALAIDPQNFKCLALRGQVLASEGLLQQAQEDLELAHQIDAKNPTVAKVLDAVRKRLAAAEAKQRKAMQSFFGKQRLVSDEELAASKKDESRFGDDGMGGDEDDSEEEEEEEE